MTQPFNRLTPAEAERLSLLIEEAAEVIQAATKIQRHGYGSYHPDRPEADNRSELEQEIGDLYYAVGLMQHKKDLNSEDIAAYASMAMATKPKHLHHQE